MPSDSPPHPAEAPAAELTTTAISGLEGLLMWVEMYIADFDKPLTVPHAVRPEHASRSAWEGRATDLRIAILALRAALLSSRGAATTERCPDCDGQGTCCDDVGPSYSCERCGGSGSIPAASPAPTATPDAWLVVAADGYVITTTANEKHAKSLVAECSAWRVVPLYRSPPTPEASVAAPAAPPEETREPTDTELLDWLDRTDLVFNTTTGWFAKPTKQYYATVREAIGAALSAPSQPGQTP